MRANGGIASGVRFVGNILQLRCAILSLPGWHNWSARETFILEISRFRVRASGRAMLLFELLPATRSFAQCHPLRAIFFALYTAYCCSVSFELFLQERNRNLHKMLSWHIASLAVTVRVTPVSRESAFENAESSFCALYRLLSGSICLRMDHPVLMHMLTVLQLYPP